MRAPPIPQRIPPLQWRKPAFLWTPLALAAAIGWPAGLFQDDGRMAGLALVFGAVIFAAALSSLGASWAFGRAPRSRRIVVAHVMGAAALVAVLAPFAMTQLLSLVAEYDSEGAGSNFKLAMGFSALPLSLLLTLPVALISAFAFAFIALTNGKRKRRAQAKDDVQPFA